VVPNSPFRSWIRKNKLYFIIGVPLLSIAFAPFPLGCGMIYPLRDHLRGHPQGRHGTQPQNLAGLWVRDETVMYDSLGQSFYLMPDGRLAGTGGMTERRWHFDNSRLFMDSVSRCGNCYQGNVTDEHKIKLIGADQMSVTNTDKDEKRGIGGQYRKVEITENLRSEVGNLHESKNELEKFRAGCVLNAIQHFEVLSRSKNLD
jgi:hypothetical protein